MKLIDILVEELKEWPSCAETAWQSQIDREIYFTRHGELYDVDDYYSDYTADVRGEKGVVTREEYLEAISQKKKTTTYCLYHCSTCDRSYPQEHSARYYCELKTSQIHRCSDCDRNHSSPEAADICCRSISKSSKVDVKTLLQAAFDLLNSHYEISDNGYSHVGSHRLDDIGGMLQDFIEQNAIHGFGEK